MSNSEVDQDLAELYAAVAKLVDESDDPEARDMKEVISGWTRGDESLQRATEEESGHAFVIHRSFP